MIFKTRDIQWNVGRRTLLMGVINVTPDSFSDGGKFLDPPAAAQAAREFEEAGADLLDIGAESSRPGAAAIDGETEKKRLLPALDSVLRRVKLPVSVDTTKAEVARAALEMGAALINDISGLKGDAGLAKAIADFKAGVILMHRRGNARTMQTLADYEDVVEEVGRELKESVDIALKAGISYEQIALDPGIGFAKRMEHNLSLIKHFDHFKAFQRPLVIGTSRKSFIGEITGRPADQRLWGTAASVALAVDRGANIVRVHDVREIKDVLRVTDAILNAT